MIHGFSNVLQYDLGIQSAQVITTGGIFPANVYCSNGKIDALTSVSDLRSADKIINAKGRYLFPGLIEPHVHLGPFNGVESDMETETRSALGGGITTIMDFVTTKSSLRSEIEKQQRIIRERALCDVGLI